MVASFTAHWVGPAFSSKSEVMICTDRQNQLVWARLPCLCLNLPSGSISKQGNTSDSDGCNKVIITKSMERSAIVEFQHLAGAQGVREHQQIHSDWAKKSIHVPQHLAVLALAMSCAPGVVLSSSRVRLLCHHHWKGAVSILRTFPPFNPMFSGPQDGVLQKYLRCRR